ncbi:thioredoxin domain-containing protein [Paenibacillus rhizoplanae]
MNNKANRSRNTPNHGRLLHMLLAVIAVLLIALLAFFLTQSKSSGTEALDNLPNYTDVKGKIVVDGLKYEKQPHLGSEAAKVKVIEFADFKCPACKKIGPPPTWIRSSRTTLTAGKSSSTS